MRNARELLNKARRTFKNAIANRVGNSYASLVNASEKFAELAEAQRVIAKAYEYRDQDTSAAVRMNVAQVVQELAAIWSGFSLNGEEVFLSKSATEATQSAESALNFIAAANVAVLADENTPKSEMFAGLRELEGVAEKTFEATADTVEVSDEIATAVEAALNTFSEQVDKAAPVASWPMDMGRPTKKPRR